MIHNPKAKKHLIQKKPKVERVAEKNVAEMERVALKMLKRGNNVAR